MIIELQKFGTTLLSRPSGREAFLAYLPVINQTPKEEVIEIDFSGVLTFTPSWGDEFITKLHEVFGDRIILRKTNNPSVIETMEMLEQIGNFKYNWK